MRTMLRTIGKIGATALAIYNVGTAILIMVLGHNIYYPTEQNTTTDFLLNGFLIFITPMLLWLLWAKHEPKPQSTWNAKEEVEKFRNKEVAE